MSVYAGPEIANDGLVFAYDMANTQKSWKGAPTTNQFTNGESLELGGWTYNGSSFGSNYKFIENSTSSNTFYFLQNTPVTVGLDYTMSFDAKMGERQFVQMFPSSGFPTGAWCNYDLFNGTYAIVGGSGAASITDIGNGWFRCSYTRACSATTSAGRFAVSTALSLADTRTASHVGIIGYGIYVKNMQFEQQSFSTPFVNGTRSTTQSILDLVGNNTIAANSLTYANDGTFSFNGSSNVITAPNNAIFDTQTPTVEVWIKTNAINQNGFWFEKGTVNTQYSLFQEGTNIVWRQGGNSQYTTTASYINTSNWAHIVGTFTTGNRRTYINGNLVTSDSLSASVGVNGSGITIGSYNSGGYFYNGSIGVVRVYNRALSASEVQQNFAAIRSRYGI